MHKKVAIGCLGILGELILHYLAYRKDVEIVGVDSITDRKGHINCKATAEKLNLPIKSYAEIVELKPDIFISISYLRKLGPEY